MASGTVKWLNGPSGFGVITADTGGGELFVYRGSLLVAGATLDAGDRVEFEAHEGGMGAQAVDVQRAGAPSEGAYVPRRGRSVLADDAADDSLRDTAVASRKEG